MELNQSILKVQLSKPLSTRVEQLIEILNTNINPEDKLSAKDVHIRAMYIVSEEVNSYGGQFHVDEMSKLANLLIDSPVLIGHRRDKLPIARNFHAELVEHQGQQWIKSYFYWLYSADGSESLKDNIDGKIYKECSIAFTFRLPECSICHKDIRKCHHEPLRQYSLGRKKVICSFYYKDIEQVLETSFVYRGAVHNTSISNDLSEKSNNNFFNQSNTLIDVTDIDSDDKFLITPNYQGILLKINKDENHYSITSQESIQFKEEQIKILLENSSFMLDNVYALVVGYRGKERCSIQHLLNYLNGLNSQVSRIELKLLPGFNQINYKKNIDWKKSSIKPIKYEIKTYDKIHEVFENLKTKDGVKVWSIASLPPYSMGMTLKYLSDLTNHNNYYLFSSKDNNKSYLNLNYNGKRRTFEFSDLENSLLHKNKRILSESISSSNSEFEKSRFTVTKGVIESFQEIGSSYRFVFKGAISGKFNLQSVIINGRNHYLFYKSNNICESMKSF